MPTLKTLGGKKEYKPQSRRKHDSKGFYQSKEWTKVRNLYIKNNPLCVECQAVAKHGDRFVVDHITPIRLGGEPLEYNNLQTMCPNCHNKKSAREKHQGK